MSLYADFTSNAYESIYKNSSLTETNFRDAPFAYTYNSSDDTYAIAYSNASVQPYGARQKYANNFKIFIPIHTKQYSFAFSRYGSSGWFDVLVSLGETPYFGENDEYKNGTFRLGDTYGTSYELTNNTSCNSQTQSCKIYFNKIDQNYPRSPYLGSNDWYNKLSDGWTIRYSDAISLTWRNSNLTSTNTNKWLYVATDIRPDSSGTANTLSLLTFITNVYVDATKVNEAVEKLKTSNSWSTIQSECTNIPDTDKAKNACYFVKAFGNDSSIVAGYESNIQPCQNTQTETVTLNPGQWNLIGSKYSTITFSSGEVARYDGDKWISINSSISTVPIKKADVGEGFWYKATSSEQSLTAQYCADSISTKTITVNKGWSMVSGISTISASCIDKIYSYNDNQLWEEVKAGSTISDNKAVWVYATSDNCNIQ